MKIISLLLFLPSLCFAGDWDTTDRILGGTALISTVIDWRQSHYIATHPTSPNGDFAETNKVLGQHPSPGRVNTYFAGGIIIGGLSANLLPSPYRKLFLGGIAYIEIDSVKHNRSIGIRIVF